MLTRYLTLLFFIIFNTLLSANEDSYLSCRTFQQIADFVVVKGYKLDPSKVKKGDIIYVEGSVLDNFIKQYNQKIKNPYILITHWCDYPMPGKHVNYLNDPKLIAWYAINVEKVKHPKLISIPIGVDVNFDKRKALDQGVFKNYGLAKSHLLYMNFNIHTYPHERRPLYNSFKDKPFCYASPLKTYEEYLVDLATSKFVLSPRGAGLDCFRTWESFYIGTIPILKNSDLNPLLEGLPVLLINDWSEVTESFLNKKYEELRNKTYNMEKISPEYWINLIKTKKIEAISG